jgi:hypothetical protein
MHEACDTWFSQVEAGGEKVAVILAWKGRATNPFILLALGRCAGDRLASGSTHYPHGLTAPDPDCESQHCNAEAQVLEP